MVSTSVLLSGCTSCSSTQPANEEAVALFLQDKISLPKLFELVQTATLAAGNEEITPGAALDADQRARAVVKENA